jgi:hypothetical protein
MKPKYPELSITLTGYFHSRMIPEAASYVAVEMKKSNVSQDDINLYYTEARKGGVEGFLNETRKWVTVNVSNLSFHSNPEDENSDA